MTIEAMKQALEALGKCRYRSLADEIVDPAITALRAAIEQAEEQEPVAWRNAAIRLGEELSSVGPDGYYNMTAEQWLDWAMDQQPRGKNSLTTPPAAQRQPLTDEEMYEAVRPLCQTDLVARALVEVSKDEYRAIEAAHGIGEKPDAA
jgi:hypothetical protein